MINYHSNNSKNSIMVVDGVSRKPFPVHKSIRQELLSWLKNSMFAETRTGFYRRPVSF